MLAVVAGALGRYLRRHGHPTGDLVLKAMVPVSVRADVERGALGNKVAAMWAPLPVGMTDPVERLLTISHAMQGIKESGQAVGAQVLTGPVGLRAADDHGAGGPAPGPPAPVQPRRDERARARNIPLYMLGRELEALYPMVPLAENTALGIAIMSYNGQLNFGFTADYDALADVEDLTDDLRSAIEELAAAAGGSPGNGRRGAAARLEQARSPRGWVKFATTALERVAIVVASLALSFGLIAVLSGFFAGRDQAGVSITQAGPGSAFPDLGAAHLQARRQASRVRLEPPDQRRPLPAAGDPRRGRR